MRFPKKKPFYECFASRLCSLKRQFSRCEPKRYKDEDDAERRVARMRQYVIQRVKGAPDWSAVPSLEIDIPYFDTPNDIFAHAQIAYDDDALYVHLSTEEKEIRAVEKGLLGAPCEDSCLEFFFSPMAGDDRYFNLEFNTNGCMYLGFGDCIETIVRLIVPNIEDILLPKIVKKEGAWEITYQIPYTFIRRFFPDFTVYAGKEMRANCYKCADFSKPPHYLSWNKVEGEPFKFHKPRCFGLMTFSK